MSNVLHLHDRDNDFHKGAFEEDNPYEKAQTSMRGQLPHRDPDPMIKAADTDFPEPGENPEHSGEETEPGANPRNVIQSQDSVQEQNQGPSTRKEDDQAA